MTDGDVNLELFVVVSIKAILCDLLDCFYEGEIAGRLKE